MTSTVQDVKPNKVEQLQKMISEMESKQQLFTGFILENLESNEVIFAHHEDKFFTPASNTKILTCLAATEILGDSIPALQYYEKDDSLFILGTGDPSFLAPYDTDSIVYSFLSQSDDTLIFNVNNLKTARFGSGWAWDDYNYYYQKENFSLPFLHMATRITTHPDSSDFEIIPSFMEDHITKDLQASSFIKREEQSNRIVINPLHKPSFEREYEVPFYITPEFTHESLSTIVNKNIAISNFQIPKDSMQTLYHTSSDSLYKYLMLYSDNFVAEQLLFLMSHELDIDMSTRLTIKRLYNTVFKEIPDRPRIVDGSGLSRYNLITPRSLTWALRRLDESLSSEQIQEWFPSKYHEGTLPRAFEDLSIRAKTGSLSNNFCLSGFLESESGGSYVFSWMNNHYMDSKTDVTKRMARILKFIEKNW